MTKSIIITSKRSYLQDTKEHIFNGTYEYYPASYGVEFLIKEVVQYNDGLSDEHKILPIVKYTKPQVAKVKLKSSKASVCMFIARLCTNRNITSRYDIKT